MAIIALKAWYLAQYEPIQKVVKRPQDSPHRLRESQLRKYYNGLICSPSLG